MKKKFIATELDSFNRMFSQLANQPNTVCWMRSLDYERQLYISPNFEAVFGNTCGSLIENPNSWNSYLTPLDTDNIQTTIDHRLTDLTINDGNNHMYFRITAKDGTVRHMRDWSVLLCNKAGTPIAIAGVGENITPEHWYASLQQSQQSTVTLPGGISLNEIIENEASVQSISLDISQPISDEIQLVYCIRVNNITIPLSKREAEVLYHLRLGKSAKETGRDLCISPRTVETHLDNIKQKACVRTKLELLTNLIPIKTTQIDK